MSADLPDHPPYVPAVYVDWSLVQYLRKDQRLEPLLDAIVRTRRTEAALLPYSFGHILDGTAGWTRLSADFRAERLRDLIFLGGLSSSIFWEKREEGNETRDVFSREGVLELCENRGRFASLRADGDPDGLLTQVDRGVALMVSDAVRKIEASAAAADPPLPEDLVRDMIASLREAFSEGVPELTDAGQVLMMVMAPVMLHSLRGAAACNEAPPEQACAMLDESLRRRGSSLAQVLATMRTASPTLADDVLGPTTLAALGYQAESRDSVRKRSPGLFADQVHSRHALSAAIFMTGERRLPRRLAAWAAHTGRGPAHGTWPVMLQVSRDDSDQISHATSVLEAYNERFEGLLTQQ